MLHHRGGDGGLLHDAAAFRQVALEHRDAAVFGIGPLHGAYDLLVAVFRRVHGLRKGFARYGHDGEIEQALLRKLLHHSCDAARKVKILHEGVARRGKVAKVRRFRADGVCRIEADRDARFMGDGRQVQHGVCGAAERHVHGFRVVEGGFGHDVAGADILFHKFHDLHARMLCKAQARGIRGGDGAVARKRHADGLRKAVHGVCGVHAGAGTAGGAGVLFIIAHAGFIERARMVGAHGFEHVAEAGAAAVLEAAREHRPAGTEDGGNVDARCGHEKAGHIFIAVGDHDEPVKLVSDGHSLRGIGDEVARDERILHADVPHCDAVAHGDGGEEHRRAAGRAHTGLDRFRDFVKVHVAGDDLVEGGHHADERAADLLFRVAERVKQAAVRRALHAGFDVIGKHVESLILVCVKKGGRPEAAPAWKEPGEAGIPLPRKAPLNPLSWKRCPGRNRSSRASARAAACRSLPSGAWRAPRAWS